MRNELNRGFGSRWLWAIFLVVGGYALVAGVFVQRVIAPAVADGSTPNGFIPELDSGGFHQMAVEMAEDIRANGWQEWELDPGWSANQPVGIMAAVYVFTGPDPIYLLPINAVIHGLSAVLLFLILRFCKFGPRESFVGVLPFAFFPSTLVWVAQFHKDGVYCLGLFAMFLGCLFILGSAARRSLICGFLLVFIGGFAVSVVRDYSLLVFVVAAGTGGFVVQVASGFVSWGRWRNATFRLVLLWVGLLSLIPIAGEKGSEGKGEAVAVDQTEATEVMVEEEAVIAISEERDKEESYRPPETPWVRSAWLPRFVDDRVHQLIHNRTIFIWLFPGGTSYVDRDHVFRSASDVLEYIPKALVIGLVAPFPHQWYDAGTTLTGNLQRIVSGGEMILSYLLILSVAVLLVVRPSRAVFFLAVAATLMILALVYPLPAVGSLYRLRFGPYSILLAIGAASLLRYWLNRRTRENGSTDV